MCLLLSQHGMSLREAESLIISVRPRCGPTEAQRLFVREVSGALQLPSGEGEVGSEDMYQRVLAAVLSLSPSFRERLAADLERLA